jgi:hypothetical protein
MKNLLKKYSANDRRMYFFVVFMFVGFSSSAQVSFESSDLNVSAKVFNIVADELPSKSSSTIINSNSNSNFILWFMGTKVGPNKSTPNEVMYTKRKIISSGTEPNRLLMKTLLKKTINTKFC